MGAYYACPAVLAAMNGVRMTMYWGDGNPNVERAGEFLRRATVAIGKKQTGDRLRILMSCVVLLLGVGIKKK